MIRTLNDLETAINTFKVKAYIYINQNTICIIYHKPKFMEFEKKKNIRAMKLYIEENKALNILVLYATLDKE